MKYYIYCICLVIILLSACANNEYTEYKNINIYYAAESINANTTKLISAQHVKLVSQSIEAEITDVFELLKSTPNDKNYISALPPDLVLNLIKIENNAAVIDLSTQYNNLSGISKTLANACLTLSLCQLNEISSVTITVNGASPNGNTDNSFSTTDFIQNKLGLINFENNLILYFMNQDKTALASEIRHTVARENESAVELIINGLMDGPTTQQYNPVIPKNTRLLSVYTEQRVCYLNLSNEFIYNRDDNESAELLTIYAIVNSITELSDIVSVQFLIEGKRIHGFTHYDLSNPIERSLDI